MKMRIINKTKWNTKDLQKVFKLALSADNEVAQIFTHELEHCRGFKHNQMGVWSKLDVSFWPSNIQINKGGF